MNFDEYQNWAHGRLRHEKARLIAVMPTKPNEPNPLTLTLASFAHVTEAGEAGDQVKKYVFHGREWDEIKPKLILELGDDLWYFAVKLKECGITLQEVIDANVAKLTARDGKDGEKFHDRKL